MANISDARIKTEILFHIEFVLLVAMILAVKNKAV